MSPKGETGQQYGHVKLLCFLIAPVIGLVVVILPVAMGKPVVAYDAPLFPTVRTGIENFHFSGGLVLMLTGVMLGALSSANPWGIGIALMALFPMIAIAEMVVDPRSHGLIPIELLSYGVMSMIGGIGAYLGRALRARVGRKRDAPDSEGIAPKQ